MREMQELCAPVRKCRFTFTNQFTVIFVLKGGIPEHYSIHASTSPSEGPFAIGSVVDLYCHISPHSPTGSTYQWKTSVPGVSIIHQRSTDPNATITIPTGHTKYGYYYCQLQKNGSTLATGFTVLEVKRKQLPNS